MARIAKYLVLSVLSLLFLLAIFAYLRPILVGETETQEDSEVRFGSPLETSSETIDFKIEGLTIRAPANRLVAMIRESDYWPGELKGGFSFVAMWPNFAPRNPENIQEFYNNTDDWGRIEIHVSRRCRQPETRIENGGKCSREGAMISSFNSYSEPLVAPADVACISALQIDGIDLAGFKKDSGRFEFRGEVYDHVYSDTIYRRIDDNGLLEFIECSRPERVPSPGCRHHFMWRGYLQVTISYKAWLLPQWAEIKEKSVALLDDAVV